MRIVLLLCALALPALGQQQPQTVTKVGTPATNAVTVQTNPAAPLAVTGSLSVSGAADTVGSSVAFNANSVCATVLLAGQLGAGFFLGAGTSAATYTPALSEDATPAAPGCTGGNWTASAFVDTSGNASATIATTNPNAFQQYGIKTLAGSRCARVCTGGSGTTGSATGLLIATTVPSPPAAAGADVTDRAGRLVGHVTVDTAPATAVTGTFWPTAAGTPGSFELSDGSAFYTGAKTGQLPSALVGGRLDVNVGAALPAGANVIGHVIADTGSTTAVTGNVTVVQGTGTNLHAVLDTTSTTAVTQATGTNLHAVLDATSTTAVTQATAANLNATVVLAAGSALAGKVGIDQTTPGTTNAVQDAATSSTGSAVPSKAAFLGGGAAGGAGNLTGSTVKAASTAPAATDTAVVVTTRDTVTVSGTVTTTPPANASTNVAQLAGTTTDTNSGTKSAGTLRVVLATDQPALTNKLLVTPDSVALPANQSVNVAQVAGTTTDTNSGTKSAGTIRVVLATDQPALTNKLLVTPDSVALPANQSVNTAQFGGTNVSTGAGAGGAGIPRVTISNDSSLAANQSVNMAQVAGTNAVTGGLAGSQGVGGLAANGAAVSGNPVYTAGLGFNGVANAPRYCDKIAAVTTLSTTVTVQQIAGVANQKIYICGYYILASTATTAVTLKWTEGTGGACGTGTANVTPAIFTTPTSAPTVANFTLGPFGGTAMPWMSTAGDGLCITQSSGTNATTLSGVMLYTQN
jgi:hypothetical protein